MGQAAPNPPTTSLVPGTEDQENAGEKKNSSALCSAALCLATGLGLTKKASLRRRYGSTIKRSLQARVFKYLAT